MIHLPPSDERKPRRGQVMPGRSSRSPGLGTIYRMAKTWDGIDDLIVEARIIQAIAEIRERFGASIPEALDLFDERYDILMQERPDDFTLPRGEYGRDVYT